MTARFAELLSRMESISKAVNGFTSTEVQLLAFKVLVKAYGAPVDSKSEEDDSAVEASTAGTILGKRARRSPRRARPERGSSESTVDVVQVVNAIKSDPRYDLFHAKIIVGKASRSERVKFVSWFTHDEKLTSGDMQRVLTGLGVKIDAPTASRGVSDASKDYLKDDSERTTRYYLSERARTEYETWLLNDAKP